MVWFGTAVAQSKTVKRKVYFTSFSPSLLSLALLGLGLAGIITIGAAPPLWKIGRAVVEWRTAAPGQVSPGQNIPVLKLSLRNEGGAGIFPVQIFGRWAAQSAPPQSLTLLGSYQREVALAQTAILEAPLIPMSKAPPGKVVLEIVVTTGGNTTDSKWIPWN